MSFYEALEKYYDDIFPLNEKTLAFLEKIFSASGRAHILDLACGTGSYTLALASRGFQATGVDLDETMIRFAEQKKEDRPPAARGGGGGNAFFLKGDMLQLRALLEPAYDGAFCIGNSLVHLQTVDEILKAAQEIAAVLRKGAPLAVQVVNYDRILEQGVCSLPTLGSKERGVSFERRYRYDSRQHLIYFTGILSLPDSTTRTNTLPLYPLRKEELTHILKDAGFTGTAFYGSFAGEPWSKDAPAIIAVAKKNKA